MWDGGHSSSELLTRAGDPEEMGRNDAKEKKRRLGAGDLSRSASPSVLGNSYPVSVRQQLALLKQMEQPSPSGSTDGDTATGARTPKTKRKRVPRVHKKNDRGETPLHVAARKGIDQDCLELIRQGADVNCADYAGWTPLHEACNHNRFETAELLLSNGANVNKASDDGETPLHDAAFSNNAKLVWLLLRHGADRTLRNRENQRPVDIVDPSTAQELLIADSLPEECPLSEPSTRSSTPNVGPSAAAAIPLSPGDVLSPLVTNNSISPPVTIVAPNTAKEVPTNVPLTVSVESNYAEDVPSNAPLCPLQAESVQTTLLATRPSLDSNILSVVSPVEHSTPQLPEGSGLESSEENSGSPSPPLNESLAIAPSTCEVGSEIPSSSVENGNLGEEDNEKVPEGSPVAVANCQESSVGDASLELDACQPVTRTAVWKTERAGSQPSTAARSPNHTFDFVDDFDESRDEVRSESGVPIGKRKSARGRPRGGRANSGNTTPVPSSFSSGKKCGRGRGQRRGKSSIATTSDTVRVASNSPVLGVAEDVYDFKESPESVEAANFSEDREVSVPPSHKRIRLTESNDPDSAVGSVQSADVEMEDIEEEDDTQNASASSRKVPPLRISLTKTPSEEDVEEENALAPVPRPKTIGRGRFGRKTAGEQEEAQRMTRSKVRQTGKVLDDGDPWSKKKRGRPASFPDVLPEEMEDVAEDSLPDRSIFEQPDVALLTDLSASQKVLMSTPYVGVSSMAKLMGERWFNDLKNAGRAWNEKPQEHANMLLTRCENLFTVVDVSTAETPTSETCLPPELHELWRTQEDERKSLESKIKVERVRIQLCVEQELIRISIREQLTTPRMSAVRLFREGQISNPLILDESVSPAPQISKPIFDSRLNKRLSCIYKRHKMESDSLFCEQRTLWEIKSKPFGGVDEESLKRHVYRVEVPPLNLASIIPDNFY